MSCKTYEEIKSELGEYLPSDDELNKAYKKAREAEFADLADAYVASRAWAIDTLNTALPYYKKQRVEILNIEDGKYAKKITYKYLKSDKQYTLNSGEYSPFTFGREGTTFDMTTKNIDVLFSDLEFIHEGTDGYETRVLDGINNPDSIVELGEELAELEDFEGPHKQVLLEKLGFIAGKLKGSLGEMIIKVNKNADRTGGSVVFNANNANVYIGVGPRNVNMSALEAYVHELVHGLTKFAIDSNSPMLAKQVSTLKRVRETVIDKFNEESVMKFMAHPDRTVAKEMLDYVSNRDVGLHEFVAYAETNATMRAMLESVTLDKKKEEYPDLASKLSGMLENLIDLVLGFINGTRGKNGLELAEAAIVNLVNANVKAQESKRKGIVTKVGEQFNAVESNIKKYMDKMEEKAKSAKPIDWSKSGRIHNNWNNLKVVGRAMVDDNYKRVLESTMSGVGLKPEGFVQTVIRDMSQSDPVQDMAERLGLLSQKVDQEREMIADITASTIRKGFDRKLEKFERDALTSVLMDTDIGAVWEAFDVKAMLEDESKLGEAIKATKGKLKGKVDEATYNYYKNQADGLGYFMTTGVGSIAQLLNAENIAKKLNTVGRKDKVDTEVVELIDQLASLHALEYVSEGDKKAVAELMSSEKNGIELIVAYQEAHKRNVEKELFSLESDKMKLIKGYSKDVYPSGLDFKIGLVSEEKAMRKLGYKKVEVLQSHSLDKSEDTAMYVSELNARQNLHRVAMRYTDKGRKGTTIGEKYSMEASGSLRNKKAERDVSVMKLEALKVAREMEKGDYKANRENANLVPVLDNLGNIKDFRYIMSKSNKVKLLKMDRNVDTVIGRTYSSRYDKETSMKFNEEVMKLIEEDAAENFREGRLLGRLNTKEYIKVEKDSDNKEIRDLWSVLPDYLKKKYENGFAVRRDLLHSYLGYREYSMTEFYGLESLPEGAKHAVRVAEKIWKDVVAISKAVIVLKLPAVLIGNVMSNFVVSVVSGSSPLKVAKLQTQGVRDLNRWIKDTKELTELRTLKNANRPVNERRISVLENDLKHNPASVLVDEGFYTTILEELENENRDTANVVKKVLDEKLEKVPRLLRDGLELLYISDRTKIFKFMNAATQYSDFVARYAQYTLLVQRGVSKEVAAKEVRDAFVNYNKPNSRSLEWANQMGFVMFTKYFTRIQKAIKGQARNHPLKLVLALVAQEWVIGDVEDITDQSVLTKDVGNMFYSPTDTFMRVITPAWGDAIKSLETL